MPSKKRVRIGIKLPGGDFYELISMRQSKNGYIVWVPETGKHFTILNEPKTISSHQTDETHNNRRRIGRLDKNLVVNDEVLVDRMYNPRKLNASEFDIQTLFIHKDWLKVLNTNDSIMKIDETEKEIIHYLDFEEKVNELKTYFAKYAEKPNQLMWMGKAGDFFCARAKRSRTRIRNYSRPKNNHRAQR